MGRIKYLNEETLKDREFVAYFMQSAVRVDYNHALEYAIKRANDLNKPLLVFFGLYENYPNANYRHFKFLLEGLKEVKEELNKKNIKLIIEKSHPKELALKISKISSLMVTDKNYLKHINIWKKELANEIDIPLVEIETNLIIPIEEVSEKEEYSAATIRKKINSIIDVHTNDFKISEIINSSLYFSYNEYDLNIEKLLIDRSVDESIYKGGISEARKHLQYFIDSKESKYDELRNHPNLDYQSNMSPYLHFGQISPLEIYLKTKDKSFYEELVVRRELAFNFVYYNENYDNYKCLPEWAIKTLEKHSMDERAYIYSIEELENYQTHDPYWNACQKEMVKTGKMHGYMRMYWGKKVIEWTKDYKEAYSTLVYLNDKYSLDGRDPNGYAGIAWCFGKHDRPWTERNVFGMVRYMNDKGLERKFDIKDYILKIDKL